MPARKSYKVAVVIAVPGSYKIAKNGIIIIAGPKPVKAFRKYAAKTTREANMISVIYNYFFEFTRLFRNIIYDSIKK